MKKYLLPILIPSMFVAFITYATIKTSTTSSDQEGPEEVVLVESVEDTPKKVEDKKVDENFSTFVASPIFSAENVESETEVSKPANNQELESKPEIETKVIKKYYDDDGDDDSEYEDEEGDDRDDD